MVCNTARLQISATAAFKKQMEERLARANAALMRTFQGDSSNSLQELRSYRVPPRITFMVLQVCRVWGEGGGGGGNVCVSKHTCM